MRTSHYPLAIALLLTAFCALAASGPNVFYVDAKRGNDDANGAEEQPWRTVRHALTQLAPGATLYLRGGAYYENVRCALAGTAEKPITIAGHPRERAVLDGGLGEFFDSPAEAWQPFPGGAPDEFRSTRPYRNLTGVAGIVGAPSADDAFPLNTYWLIQDLRSAGEVYHRDKDKKLMDSTVYCGPGLWYDRLTGYIHIRLSHTHQNVPGEQDYTGETDARNLRMVIAPIESVPLSVDHARHVRFRNLVVQGAGKTAIDVQYSAGVEFENVTVRMGALRGGASGPVKVLGCDFIGPIAPWVWRIDSSKGCADGGTRDVVRMLVPTLLETSEETLPSVPRVIADDAAAGRVEGLRAPDFNGADAALPQMTWYPRNHDWEIAHCVFVSGHDGIFLNGRNMRLHHNLILDMQDDAVDFSAADPDPSDSMFIYHNLIQRCVTALSTHNYGTARPRGKVFIYRNVIDMRQGVRWMRPSDDKPQGMLYSGMGFFMHGSDHATHIESAYLYHNLIVAPVHGGYSFGHGAFNHVKPEAERRVFNNIFVYDPGDRYVQPFYGVNLREANIQVDGNLHWVPNAKAEPPRDLLEKLRRHPLSEHNLKNYPAGFGSRSLAADPKFVRYSSDPATPWDLRLEPDSPAINAGVPLPPEWPDPLRDRDGGPPDIGPFPAGVGPDDFILGPAGRERP